jgi:cell division protein FtsA
VGRSRPITGLPEAATGPAFTTCAGLLHYAVNQPPEGLYGTYRPTDEPGSRFGRFGQWLRENF